MRSIGLSGFGGMALAGRTRRGPSLHPLIAAMGGSDWAWFDMSDLSTLWQDTEGTIPAGVGDTVARVDDKSGNGFHAMQADPAKRPVVTDAYSKIGLYFTEAQTLLVDGSLMGDTEHFSVVAWNYMQPKLSNTVAYLRLYHQPVSGNGLFLDRRDGRDYIQFKMVRSGGTDNRPSLSTFISETTVGDDVLVTSQHDLLYSRLAWNGAYPDDTNTIAANTGTAFNNNPSESIELISTMETVAYGAVLSASLVSQATRRIAEDELSEGMAITLPPERQIAHRGLADRFTENTLDAWQQTYGIDPAIEWEGDMQISADGTPWMFHDGEVSGLTDGSGSIPTMTDAQIAALTVDAGNGGNQPVPKLYDVLAWAAMQSPQPRFWYEIKDMGSAGTDGIDTIMEMMAASGLVEMPILTSFDKSDLDYVRSQDASWPIGHTVGSTFDYATFRAEVQAYVAQGGETYAILQANTIKNYPDIAVELSGDGASVIVYSVTNYLLWQIRPSWNNIAGLAGDDLLNWAQE